MDNNRRILIGIAVLVLAGIWYTYSEPTTRDAAETEYKEDAGSGAVERLFRFQTSGVVVETAGTVDRTLPDDNEGSRHQRFILELSSGHTVLISHNIDLAPRIPLQTGDTVQLRGEYEWNSQGGVIHWTHHDPQGYRPGGWIDHAGKRYE